MSDNEEKTKTVQAPQGFYPYGLPYGYHAAPGYYPGPVPAPQPQEQVTQTVVYVPYPVYAPHHGHANAYVAQPVAEPVVKAAETTQAAATEHHGGLFSGEHKDALVKGVVLGAGLTYLLTNETVQRNLIGAAVKLWSSLQGGVEEVKERFRDAEADLHSSGDR